MVSKKHCLDENKTNPSLLVHFSDAGEYKFIIHNGGLDLANNALPPVVPPASPGLAQFSATSDMNPLLQQGQQGLPPASPSLIPVSPALPPASPGLTQLSTSPLVINKNHPSPVQNPLIPKPGLAHPSGVPPPSGVPSPLLDIHSQSPAPGQLYPQSAINTLYGGRIHSRGTYGTVLEDQPQGDMSDIVLKKNSCSC